MSSDRRQPMLRGQLVWLRPLGRRDLDDYLAAMNDVDIGDPAGVTAPRSRDALDRWFTDTYLPDEGSAEYRFAICRLGEDAFLGMCGLKDIDVIDGTAMVAIFLADTSVWGKGYGTDAVNALVDFGFGHLGLERIWLEVGTFNQRAIAAYEKAGFEVEAILRSYMRRHGELVDFLLMALIRPDWEALERPRSWEAAG